jgi:hypothetical protein
VADELSRPVAVQIDYEDWIEIERSLGLPQNNRAAGLRDYSGSISLGEDPLAYQRMMRREWS